MSDSSTGGVLLKSENGSHYFIPQSDLSQYAVQEEVAGEVVAAAPRVEAFSVTRTGGTEPGTTGYSAAAVAFPPFPEG